MHCKVALDGEDVHILFGGVFYIFKQEWKECDMVSAKWSDGTYYPAKIVKVISKGNKLEYTIICICINLIYNVTYYS